jgi:hypothetical protein
LLPESTLALTPHGIMIPQHQFAVLLVRYSFGTGSAATLRSMLAKRCRVGNGLTRSNPLGLVTAIRTCGLQGPRNDWNILSCCQIAESVLRDKTFMSAMRSLLVTKTA